jgi:hypothetical protein
MLRNALQRSLRTSLTLIVASIPGLSQTPSNIKQEAKDSACSNIVALAGNVNINCFSLTPAQRKLIEGMPAVLNKILANELDPSAVMEKLDEILHEVNPNAPKITYTFEGFKRVISPGRFSGEEEGGGEVFLRMASLERTHDWAGLLKVSEAQIKERPLWLTPYFEAGIANMNLGNKQKAIELLEYAEKRAAGNPDYDPMSKQLANLLRQLGAR